MNALEFIEMYEKNRKIVEDVATSLNIPVEFVGEPADVASADLKDIPLVHFGRSDELKTPRFPMTKAIEQKSNEEWYGNTFKCDLCHKRHIWDNFRFCPDCGHKIQW